MSRGQSDWSFGAQIKLSGSYKNMHEMGYVAELQTWPSLMSQLRKTLLNLLSVSRDTYLLFYGRYEEI